MRRTILGIVAMAWIAACPVHAGTGARTVELAYHDGTIGKTQMLTAWYNNGPHGPGTYPNAVDNSLVVFFDTSKSGLSQVTKAWISFYGCIRPWDWNNYWGQNTLNFNLGGSVSTYSLGTLAGSPYGMPTFWNNGIGEDEVTGLSWITVPVNTSGINLNGTTTLTMYLLYGLTSGQAASVGIGIDNHTLTYKSGRGSSTNYVTNNLRWNSQAGNIPGEYMVSLVLEGIPEIANHDGGIEKTQQLMSWYSDGPHGPATPSQRDNSAFVSFDETHSGLQSVTNAWVRFYGIIGRGNSGTTWRNNVLHFDMNGYDMSYSLGTLSSSYGMPTVRTTGIAETMTSGLGWVKVPVSLNGLNLNGSSALTLYLLRGSGGDNITSLGLGIDTTHPLSRSGRGSPGWYDTATLRWNPASGNIPGEYTATLCMTGTAVTTPKVYYAPPTTSVWTPPSNPLSYTFPGSWKAPTVAACKGESEPVQVVVETAAAGLDNVSWSCGDLTSGANTLSASAVDIKVVGYALMSDNVTWWPDPLFAQPAGGISVPANTRRAWWVTVNVPTGQAAGLYKGTLDLSGGGKKLLSALFSVKVADLSFPSPLPMGVSIGCGVSAAVLPLAEARHLYPSACWTGVQLPTFTYDNASNQVTVDFTTFDQTVNQLRSTYGMKYICLGFVVGNAGGDSDRATTLHPYMNYTGGGQGRVSIDPDDNNTQTTARFNSIFQQYASHLAAVGWLNDSFIYLWDEPNTDPLAQEAARYAGYFKAAAPTLPVMVTTDPSTTLQSVDTFCTLVNHVSDSTWQWCQANGKHFWIYTCGNLQYPSLTLGKPGLDSRIFGWVGYRYYAENLLFWAADVSYTQAQLQPDGLSFTNVYGDGDGCLVYPGSGGSVLPSTRSENLRDGLEDLYLMKLAEGMGLTSTCQSFVQTNIPSQTSYNTNPSVYMSFRNLLFQQLSP